MFRICLVSCSCRQRQQRIRIYFNLTKTLHSAHSWNISTRTKHLEYQNSIHFPQEEKPAVCVHVRKSEAVLKYNLKCWWKLNTLLKMLNTDTFAPSTPWSFDGECSCLTSSTTSIPCHFPSQPHLKVKDYNFSTFSSSFHFKLLRTWVCLCDCVCVYAIWLFFYGLNWMKIRKNCQDILNTESCHNIFLL